MATLEMFLKTGQLGPIRLGMDPFEVFSVLGDPQDQSRKKNPLELKYGALHLTFWKHAGQAKPQLLDIALYCQPAYQGVPEPVTLTDLNPNGATTEREFRSFLHGIAYLPSHLVDGVSGRHLIMPSGVVACFTDGRLHSLKLSQQQSKEKAASPLSDEREPSIAQIEQMLAEAESLMSSGMTRGAIVLAWAGLEATLRRVALNVGLRGQIGVQPTILVRELYSRRILETAEVNFLEEARQARTAVVHGLAAYHLPDDLIPRTINIAKQLLERERESQATPP